jgi:molecular chaperone GrpE (heat shock protein)|tara:strand:+ start:3592 stop:3831 length:240 start_codon:yes stop_codon:yes gene_type:complete
MDLNDIKNFEMMKHHYNQMIEFYEKMPYLVSNIHRTLIEDAMTTIAAVMEGVTAQLLDVIDDDEIILEVKNKVEDEMED